MGIHQDHTLKFFYFCNLGRVLYQFSSVLHQFSWSLFRQKLYWYHSFQICFLVRRHTEEFNKFPQAFCFVAGISLLEALNTLLNPCQKNPKFWLIFQDQLIGGM